MSYYTTVEVYLGICDDEVRDAVVQPFPFEKGSSDYGRRLRPLFEEGIGGRNYGTPVYHGFFNHLDVGKMVDWFKNLPWDGWGYGSMTLDSEHEFMTMVVMIDGKAELDEAWVLS